MDSRTPRASGSALRKPTGRRSGVGKTSCFRPTGFIACHFAALSTLKKAILSKLLVMHILLDNEEVNRDIIESIVQYDAGDKDIYHMQKRSTNSL